MLLVWFMVFDREKGTYLPRALAVLVDGGPDLGPVSSGTSQAFLVPVNPEQVGVAGDDSRKKRFRWAYEDGKLLLYATRSLVVGPGRVKREGPGILYTKTRIAPSKVKILTDT
jgi:hypothetical protein